MAISCPEYWLCAEPIVAITLPIHGQPYLTWRCGVCDGWHFRMLAPRCPACLQRYPLDQDKPELDEAISVEGPDEFSVEIPDQWPWASQNA